MKKLIIIMLVSMPSALLFSQDISQSQVPSVVLNAFKLKFTTVTDLEWELKGETYKAEFEIDRRDHDVWIDKNGNILKHKTDIPSDQLPTPIKEKISADYKNYRIDDVDKIEANDKVIYLVELDSNSGDIDVAFAPDGKIQTH